MKYALFTLLGLFVSSMAVASGSVPPTTPTPPRPSAPAQVKKTVAPTPSPTIKPGIKESIESAVAKTTTIIKSNTSPTQTSASDKTANGAKLNKLTSPTSSSTGGNFHSTDQETSSLQSTGSPTDTNGLITDSPTTPQ